MNPLGARTTERAAVAALVALVAMACIPVFQNAFVWDDIYVIERGDVIFHPENLPTVFSRRTMFISSNNATLPTNGAQTYRPLTAATFFWDAWLSGRTPTSYHLTNLVAHICATLLLFLLLRRFASDSHIALPLWGAAMFGVAPDLAEAHIWINGRSDLFAGLFAVGAALVLSKSLRISSARTQLRGSLVAGVLFLASLFSKESTLGLLFVLPWVPSDDATRRARTHAFFVLSGSVVAYFVMRTHALDGVHAADGSAQIATAIANAPLLVADGTAELLAPMRVTVRALSEDYASLAPIPRIAITVVACVALIAFGIASRRNERLRFGGAWLVVTLLPAAFVTTTLWPGFGRLLYVPAIGLGIVVVESVRLVVRRIPPTEPRAVRLLALGAALHIALLSARLFTYTHAWRNEETLYRQWIDEQPDRPHGYAWLGMTYLERGNERSALEYLRLAADRSPRDLRFRAMRDDLERRRGDVRTAP